VRGMQQMESAANGGHYFKPFAEVMLALAYEREHDNASAQKWLEQLATEYPDNPVFQRELAIVNKKIGKNS
jgi:predicted Zn-dependent protease